MSPLIIIGSGLAGFTLAREWRKLDPATPLHIFTCDDGEFYSKPMLSNAIAGGKSAAQLATKTATQMAQELNAEISAHTEISAIHPDRHSIGVNGQEIAYSRLVLAQGADPIRLPLRGNGADGYFLSGMIRLRPTISPVSAFITTRTLLPSRSSAWKT